VLKRNSAEEKENEAELQNAVDMDFEELSYLYAAQTELILRQKADAAAMG
jgi:hypothetical protein